MTKRSTVHSDQQTIQYYTQMTEDYRDHPDVQTGLQELQAKLESLNNVREKLLKKEQELDAEILRAKQLTKYWHSSIATLHKKHSQVDKEKKKVKQDVEQQVREEKDKFKANEDRLIAITAALEMDKQRLSYQLDRKTVANSELKEQIKAMKAANKE